MRDLSKIPLGRARRKSTQFSNHLRTVVIGAVLVGILYIALSKLNVTGSSSPSVTLREAQRGLLPVTLSDEHEQLTAGAVNLSSQKATLADLRYGGKAKATASRSYGGSIYRLTVDATLPDPVNTNYQVWIVGGGEVIPVEFMRGSGTKWTISVSADAGYANYDGIWITLERTRDEIPEEHIMEGSF